MKKCKRNGCFSDGICKDGRCGKHTFACQSRANHNGRRKPRTNVPHIGVEIECEATSSEALRVMSAQSLRPHADGSLTSMGCEFKICVPENQTDKVIRFAGRLSECGAKITSDCGLHVHMDARGIRHDRQIQFLEWMQSQQDWIFSIMPPSRQNNHFCKKLSGSSHYWNHHYQWAHMTDYNTIEIRVHGGTLNPHKINGWLSVCKDWMKWLRSGEELPPGWGEVTPSGIVDRTKPSPSWIASVFGPIAREYLQARQAGGGILAETQTHRNVETEVA